MTKNLVIVESPTKSKTIEKFLGKTYTVKASMGHLRDLPKSTFGVDVENDFEPKYINIRGKGDLIKELKTMAKKADKVYLATDPDREGEAISWHLAHILGIEPERSCRIVFHEITSTAVKEAIKHPRVIDQDMVDAQQARRILDRLVGYQLSPLLWRKIRKGLSAGRVQSVAVKIVADRDRAIEQFVPEEYWTINVKLRETKDSPLFEAKLEKYKEQKLEIKNEDQALAIEADLQQAAYAIADSSRKDTFRKPAAPFTTSSLQQEANRKINFSAKKTMMVAQQLYEGVSLGKSAVGLITYMRTDSVRFADVALEEIRSYIEDRYGSSYRPAKPRVFKAKGNAQDAHEAIRPTSISRTPEDVARYLTKDQLRLYTLIWNRAVASQMSDAIFDSTSLTIAAGDYQLKATGSVLKFPGFLALTPDMEEKDKQVPFIAAGTELAYHKVQTPKQHFTEPPAHYTEASLVKELEEQEVGRPSTYAPTIQTILDRGYVRKEAKKLLITDLGLMVVDMLAEYFKELIDIKFSANLEKDLDNIADPAKGIDKNQVLHKFYDPFKEQLAVADKNIEAVEIAPEVSDVLCDKCAEKGIQTYLVVKESRFGKFLACPNFPECRNTKPIFHKIGVACPHCGHQVIERKTRTGKIFYGCEQYPECDYTTWDKPLNEKCDLCGSMLVEHVELNRSRNKYCSNEACVKARPQPKPKRAKAVEAAEPVAAKPAAKRATSTRAAKTKAVAKTKTPAKAKTAAKPAAKASSK